MLVGWKYVELLALENSMLSAVSVSLLLSFIVKDKYHWMEKGKSSGYGCKKCYVNSRRMNDLCILKKRLPMNNWVVAEFVRRQRELGDWRLLESARVI